MSAVRNNPRLWSKIKEKLLNENGGKWNARLAQRAVKIYKQKGGTYNEKVKREKTSLHKWTREDWGYINKPGDRYLPKKVRDSLTPQEKLLENSKKQGKLGKRIGYSGSVKEKMRRANIF
jgi:lipopolysaccharide export LptBFGC system permease protein LptF